MTTSLTDVGVVGPYQSSILSNSTITSIRSSRPFLVHEHCCVPAKICFCSTTEPRYLDSPSLNMFRCAVWGGGALKLDSFSVPKLGDLVAEAIMAIEKAIEKTNRIWDIVSLTCYGVKRQKQHVINFLECCQMKTRRCRLERGVYFFFRSRWGQRVFRI